MFHNLWLAQSLPITNRDALTKTALVGDCYRSAAGKPMEDTPQPGLETLVWVIDQQLVSNWSVTHQ